MIFKDRIAAGDQLAEKIITVYPELVESKNAVVLGIPRGGVVVAAEVSKVLKCPLDVVVVRKLGVPGHEELAFGAVDLDGNTVIDWELVKGLNLPVKAVEGVREKELAEAKRRERVFRRGRGPLDLKDKEVLVVDDGVATGATAEAAVDYALSKSPSRVILAAPVVAVSTVQRLNLKYQISNFGFIYLEAPENFAAVGQFYVEFSQVTDAEVVKLLC